MEHRARAEMIAIGPDEYIERKGANKLISPLTFLRISSSIPPDTCLTIIDLPSKMTTIKLRQCLFDMLIAERG